MLLSRERCPSAGLIRTAKCDSRVHSRTTLSRRQSSSADLTRRHRHFRAHTIRSEVGWTWTRALQAYHPHIRQGCQGHRSVRLWPPPLNLFTRRALPLSALRGAIIRPQRFVRASPRTRKHARAHTPVHVPVLASPRPTYMHTSTYSPTSRGSTSADTHTRTHARIQWITDMSHKCHSAVVYACSRFSTHPQWLHPQWML
jgi:hypothetical protein